jgi:thymidylate synthase (FAD)
MEKGHTFKVLDHGYLKLVDWMGTDEDIIEGARQSTGRGFEGWDPSVVCKICRVPGKVNSNDEFVSSAHNITPDHKHVAEHTRGDAKLLEYLYKSGHTTPFEMCVLKIQVQAPIMVFREWHRHRTQSYGEMSARYIQMPNLHYLPSLERIQKQSSANKQGSAEALPTEEAERVLRELQVQQESVYQAYDNFVNERGIAKEVARLNTPVSRYSRMMSCANLHNWLGFLRLRMSSDAQWEIRQYANAAGEIVKSLWPRTYELFEEHTLYSKKLSRTEYRALLESKETSRQ